MEMKVLLVLNIFKSVTVKKYKDVLLCFIFVMLFVGFDAVIGGILSYYEHFDKPDMHSLVWSDLYKKENNSIDVMFLGSSHARFAFDTRIFDSKLNVKTFNLSSSEQTPLIGYYSLKEALEYQKPKLLVYEAYWRVFGINDNTTPAYFVYDYMKGASPRFGLLASMSDNENFSSFLLQALCKSYKYRDGFFPAVKNISDGRIIKPHKDADEIQYSDFKYVGDGFFSSDKAADNDKLYKKNPFKKAGEDFSWNKAQLEYFEKTIRLCESNNIKVVVVTAPLPKPSMDYVKHYDEYSAKIKGIADSHGIEYIDYNIENKQGKTFKNELFFDSNHLNFTGTQLLDNELMPVIKKYLN